MAVINAIRIVEALAECAEHEGLRVTVTESAKGALWTGSFAFIGGLVGGPIGLGVGGVIGACTAAVKGKGKFKPVSHVLMHDMTPQQRERLATSLIQAFARTIGVNDMFLLLSMIMTDQSIKAVALDVLKKFLTNEGYLMC